MKEKSVKIRASFFEEGVGELAAADRLAEVSTQVWSKADRDLIAAFYKQETEPEQDLQLYMLGFTGVILAEHRGITRQGAMAQIAARAYESGCPDYKTVHNKRRAETLEELFRIIAIPKADAEGTIDVLPDYLVKGSRLTGRNLYILYRTYGGTELEYALSALDNRMKSEAEYTPAERVILGQFDAGTTMAEMVKAGTYDEETIKRCRRFWLNRRKLVHKHAADPFQIKV